MQKACWMVGVPPAGVTWSWNCPGAVGPTVAAAREVDE